MRRIQTLCAVLALAGLCTPAYSFDPLTLILLRALRDKVISSGVEGAVERATSRPSPPTPTLANRNTHFHDIDDAKLRRIIDEGFVYLTPAQRGEVYSSVRGALADPRNALAGPAIIAELSIKASATRQAYEQLNGLSPIQKRQMVDEARVNYESLSVESRIEMVSALQLRQTPIPPDIADMILAELNRAPVPPTPPEAVPKAPPLVATSLTQSRAE